MPADAPARRAHVGEDGRTAPFVCCWFVRGAAAAGEAARERLERASARGAAGWVVGLTARGAARKAAIARERRDGGGGAKRRARPAAEQRTAGHAPSQRRNVHKAKKWRKGS